MADKDPTIDSGDLQNEEVEITPVEGNDRSDTQDLPETGASIELLKPKEGDNLGISCSCCCTSCACSM